MLIFTRAWWVAAGQRAAYTALAALLPLVTLVFAGTVDVVHVLLVVALAVVVSLATSAAALPELTDTTVPLWKAVTVRVLRTTGQTLVANVGGAVILTDLDWGAVVIAVAGAAATTLVRTVLARLPETAA